MMTYKALGITDRQIKQFNDYQKKVFFSKADLPIPDGANVKNAEIHITNIIKHTYKGITPLKIERLKPSTFHAVYLVTSNDFSYIVRISLLTSLFKAFHFLIEEKIMDDLKKNHLPFLQIKTDLSRSLVPFDYQIVEVAKKKTLYQLSQEGEMNKKLFFQLGGFVGRIHQIKTNNFGRFNIASILSQKRSGMYVNWKGYIFLNLDKHLGLSLKHDLIDQEILKRIKKVFLQYAFLLDSVSSRLLHGDIANHNTFTDGKKITALIDWEDCLSGDPIYDVAYFGTGVFNNQAWFDSFMDGYKTIQDLPDDFLIRYWLYFLRISLAKAVARKRFHLQENAFTKNANRRILDSLLVLESL